MSKTKTDLSSGFAAHAAVSENGGRTGNSQGPRCIVRFVQAALLMCIAVALLFCASFHNSAARAQADALYTYTVTISAGGHGVFASTNGISVDNRRTGSSYQIANDGKTVRITGLLSGDIVSCNAPAAVQLENNSKYYVKGIRQSGRDNNTVSASAFEVTRDQNYVVAYGIPGELTEYTIYYVDEEGAELAPSQSYFGNVGDEPVIAYLYIDGYVPATYNESRPLVSDPMQNEFVFVYMLGAPQTEDPNAGAADADETPQPTVKPSATPIVTEDPNATEEIYVTNIPGDTVIEYIYTEDPANANGDGSGNGDDADGSDGSSVTDGNGGGTILDRIADAVVPLANFVKEKVAQMTEDGTLIPAIIILLAMIVLIILLILFMKRKKKDEEEEEEEEPEEAQGEGEAEDEKSSDSQTKEQDGEDRAHEEADDSDTES